MRAMILVVGLTLMGCGAPVGGSPDASGASCWGDGGYLCDQSAKAPGEPCFETSMSWCSPDAGAIRFCHQPTGTVQGGDCQNHARCVETSPGSVVCR